MTNVPLYAQVSDRVKAGAERQAKRDQLTLTDVVRLLLYAYAKGEISIDVRNIKKAKS